MPFIFQLSAYAGVVGHTNANPQNAQKELASKLAKILGENDFSVLRIVFGRVDAAYKLKPDETLRMFASHMAGFGDGGFRLNFPVSPKYGDTTEARRSLVALVSRQMDLFERRLKQEFPDIGFSISIDRAASGSGMYGDAPKNGVQYVKKRGWVNIVRKPSPADIARALQVDSPVEMQRQVLATVPKKNGASTSQEMTVAQARAGLVREYEEAGRRRNWGQYHTYAAEIEVFDLAVSSVSDQKLLETYRTLAENSKNSEYRHSKYPVYQREYYNFKKYLEKQKASVPMPKPKQGRPLFTRIDKSWAAMRESLFASVSTKVNSMPIIQPPAQPKIVLEAGAAAKRQSLRQGPAKKSAKSASAPISASKQSAPTLIKPPASQPAKALVPVPQPLTFEQLAHKYYDEMGCGTIALGFEISTRKAIVSYYKNGKPRKTKKVYVYTPVKGIDYDAFCAAFKAYVNATTGKLDDPRFKSGKFDVKKGKFLLVDFSKPSNMRRLYVLDFENKQVVAALYGAHGSGSGNLTVEKVTNQHGSLASSAGLFRLERYGGGKYTRSTAMDMNGYGFNENSERRGLLVHVFRGPFPRGSDNYYRRLPRSWGCVATNKQDYKKFIESLPSGTGMYIYANVAELDRTPEKMKQKIVSSDAVETPSVRDMGKSLGDLTWVRSEQ